MQATAVYRRMRPVVLCLAIILIALFLRIAPVSAGDVQQITNFGNNPSGIGMYLYSPSNLVAKPPILVGVHACHGKGTDVCNSGNAFAQQADKYGFLMICPSAISSDGCWDVHSTAVLTHNGGGDASGIVSMVNWVVQNKNGDVNRVYVAGHSSGGMMTNVLLGSYPDVFKAGAAFAGVPFACFAQGSVDSLGWNTSCATGKVTKTGTQWGELVKAAYPGFSGARPRMQLWHGTKDDVIYFQNFKEEIKQWTNVLGVSETPTATENNAIQGSWIRTRYANTLGMVQVEAIEETDQPHNLVVDAAAAIHFFGLDGSYEVPDAGVKDSGTSAKAGSGSSAGVGAIGSGGFSVVGSAGFAGRLGSTGNTSGVGGGAFGGAGSNSIVVTVSNGGTTVTATAAGAGSGGSITPGQNPSGSKSSGCSCHTGAGGSVPSGGFWMISLLLGLGFYRRSQQRYSSDSSNKAIP